MGGREGDDVGKIWGEELTEHVNELDCGMDEGKAEGGIRQVSWTLA